MAILGIRGCVMDPGVFDKTGSFLLRKKYKKSHFLCEKVTCHFCVCAFMCLRRFHCKMTIFGPFLDHFWATYC